MKIRIELSENLHFKASARHFSDIHIDEPESFHGTDLGPSSVEYMLIGVGGCLGSTFTFCLKKKKVEINSLEIILDGILKHSEPNLHLRLIKIDCQINISINADQYNVLEECIKTFQKYCVVSKSIINGIPVDVKIKKIKK